MEVLGVDPGIGITGYAVISCDSGKCRAKDIGVIKTPVGESLERRLLILRCELSAVLEKYKVSEASIERLYFSINKKTALDVAHARGVVMELLAGKDITVYQYSPNQVKKAITGNGKCGKSAIQKMVQKLLALPGPLNQDDAADAAANALCHLSVSPAYYD